MSPLKSTSLTPPSTGCQPEQRRLFASPERYYRLERKGTGKISALWSPGARKHDRGKEIIYKIKHETTGKAKIGKTSQGFTTRMGQYLSCANHPESERGQSQLSKDLRRSPDKFLMGVVTTLDRANSAYTKENMVLGDLETAVIRDHNTMQKGYNQRLGGGGGDIVQKPAKQPLRGLTHVPQEYKTPEKGHPIQSRKRKRNGRKKERFSVCLTPNTSKKKGVVYGFRRDDGKWLIGETDQLLRRRMYDYNYAFNHPEKEVGRRPLPSAVREEPKRWKVYALYEGEDSKEMERLWIKGKNAIENGFNQRNGGGGPARSRRKLF